MKFRERSKATSNNECGEPCSGALLESQSFVQDKCVKKVTDCMFGVWSEWTLCHSSADQSVRSRSIVQQPTDTGRPCEGPTKLTRPCGASKQPTACQFSPWREWTTCSSTCGEGRHTRLRRIDQEALHGGEICVGVLLETVPCSLPPCGRSDCRVTEWSSWSDCAEEGQTQRLRRRAVQQMPAGGGLVCPTELVVTAGCPAAPPQNCSLTEWTPWTSCDKTCDGGQSYRERQLNQPSSAKGFCPASVMKESIQCNTAPCYNPKEHDCILGEWDDWTACSAQCGKGQKHRVRRVMRPATSRGKGCEGPMSELFPCEDSQCHQQDCRWSDWDEWSDCSCTCGGGVKKRNRVIAVSPRHGGKLCPPEVKSEISPCNTHLCDRGCVDAVWAPWQEWSKCSASCSMGYRSRSRQIEVEANHCGLPVGGLREQFESCTAAQPCVSDRDCQLTMWASWSKCSCSCFGIRERTRNIKDFASGNGKPCDGLALKVIEACNDDDDDPASQACGEPLPQDCQLSEWSEWSKCSLSCGGGQKERRREVQREPAKGGKACDNSLSVTAPCNTQLCQPAVCLDCQWGAWSDWGDCSRCGGQRFRHRAIMKMPNECGKVCHPRSAREVSACSSHCETTKYCAWSSWTSTSSCNTGCGASAVVRNRVMALVDAPGSEFFFKGLATSSCSATQLNVSACPPSPECQPKCQPRNCEFGSWSEWNQPSCVGLCERHRTVLAMNNECGTPCMGALQETKHCEADCQIAQNCKLSMWSSWSGCEEAGQAGNDVAALQKFRERQVLSKPKNGGVPCEGSLRETTTCKESSEDTDCLLSKWSSWGVCSHSCGRGWKMRSRQVMIPAQGNGQQCTGPLQEIGGCGTDPLDMTKPDKACGSSHDCEFESWTEWSGLDGDNQRFRTRKVAVPASGGGTPCDGPLHETETGHEEKVDCQMSSWTSWSVCDRTCGGGQSQRQRQVERFPKNNGATCPQELLQTRGCTLQACDSKDAEISDWTDWSQCSTTCGPANQARKRQVLALRGEGGEGITADLAQTRPCADNLPCEKYDCEWHDWSDWSDCTCTCGGGQRTRDRSVRRMPSHGGEPCQAKDKEEIEPCNMQKCHEDNCIDGEFGAWSNWGMCSASCGGGVSFRHRAIVQDANECGKEPAGKARQTRFCNTDVDCEAPVDCLFASWSQWTPCTRTCDGLQRRNRRVDRFGRGKGKWCVGNLKETRTCNPVVGDAPPAGCSTGPIADCRFSMWGVWSVCSATCDGGMHTRSRTIVSEAANGGQACEGPMTQVRECSRNECVLPPPRDCKLGDWREWGACGKCNGQRFRSRNIIQYAENGGLNCDDADTQEATSCPRQCHEPSYCVWSDWEAWSRCSVRCGTGGKRNRRRWLEITSDKSRALDVLPPVEDLLQKYSRLYSETQDLQDSHIWELVSAFAAGCVAFVTLLGLVITFSDNSVAAASLSLSSRTVSRRLNLMETHADHVDAEGFSDDGDLEDVGEVGLELPLRVHGAR